MKQKTRAIFQNWRYSHTSCTQTHYDNEINIPTYFFPGIIPNIKFHVALSTINLLIVPAVRN